VSGQALLRAAQDWMNPPARLTGRRFDTDAPLAPPAGPYRTAHHGIVIPGLPEPLRYLSVITLLSRPPLRWRTPAAGRAAAGTATAAAATTGTVTVGTAVPGASYTAGYRAATCALGSGDTVFRFGGDLALTGSYPRFRLTGRRPGLAFDLTLTATDVVTSITALRGRLRDHQSVLCRYRGTVTCGGTRLTPAGLCVLEYARGVVGAPPFRRFTYHVVAIDDRTQVVFADVLGPARIPFHRALHVRRLGEGSRTYRTGFTFTPVPSPSGPAADGLPAAFTVAVADDGGTEVFRMSATTDPAPAGPPAPAGSYRFEGRLHGEPVSGTGYGEYLLRPLRPRPRRRG
jgi:hypothetical protein